MFVIKKQNGKIKFILRVFFCHHGPFWIHCFPLVPPPRKDAKPIWWRTFLTYVHWSMEDSRITCTCKNLTFVVSLIRFRGIPERLLLSHRFLGKKGHSTNPIFGLFFSLVRDPDRTLHPKNRNCLPKPVSPGATCWCRLEIRWVGATCEFYQSGNWWRSL